MGEEVEGPLPSRFCDFLLGKIDHYEDAGIIAERDENGNVTMTGKPLRPAFFDREGKPWPGSK